MGEASIKHQGLYTSMPESDTIGCFAGPSGRSLRLQPRLSSHLGDYTNGRQAA